MVGAKCRGFSLILAMQYDESYQRIALGCVEDVEMG
jgi:hypothetical protein